MIDEECIADEEELKTYLDPSEWGYYRTYLYYNQEFFDAEHYGDESIYRSSKISEIFLDSSKPKWFDFDYESYELND